MKAFVMDGDGIQIVPDYAAAPAGSVEVPLHASALGAVELVFDGEIVWAMDSLNHWFVDGSGKKHPRGLDPAWQLVECTFRDELKQGEGGWELLSVQEKLRRELLDYAAAARWTKETSGIVVAGISVATDDRSKQMLMGARIAADQDPDFTTPWVAADGSIHPLTAGQVIAVSNAVLQHVAACFAKFAEVAQLIGAGTITAREGVDAKFAEIGAV